MRLVQTARVATSKHEPTHDRHLERLENETERNRTEQNIR